MKESSCERKNITKWSIWWSNKIRICGIEEGMMILSWRWWWLIEEFNTVRNGFIVMRVRGIVRATWCFWRLKSIRWWISVPTWWWRTIIIISRGWWRRRNREHKTHDDLAKSTKQLHGWEIELIVNSSALSLRSMGFFKFNSTINIVATYNLYRHKPLCLKLRVVIIVHSIYLSISTFFNFDVGINIGVWFLRL